jgi:tRNA modification GTPase
LDEHREASAESSRGWTLDLHGDTIVAQSTPPGRSAIAIVRLSGKDAFAIAARVLEPSSIVPRQAALCAVRDTTTSQLLDRAVVITYPGPRSYTGEDLVEIATHGGFAVPALVTGALISAGAREALPGEFTRRAVLHGKMDVVQAEAIGDLIDARSQAMHHAAMAQLDGGLSRRIASLRDGVIHVEALIAYDIDFPEEDDGPIDPRRIRDATEQTIGAIDRLLATAPVGELVREGAVVVIAGLPNAGKSSLFNALLGQARAIVTDVPGTTRDALEAVVDVGPWPLRLIDTAGLRETEDVIERLGIEVSEQWLARAHVVLACGDDAGRLDDIARRVQALTDVPVIPVRTKADLGGADSMASAEPAGDDGDIAVSAVTGDGLAALTAAVVRVLADRYGAPSADVPLLTRARHQRALREARDELMSFRRAWEDEHLPAPIAAVHLRAAAGALESVIGAVDVEDVLDRLFSTFCVGK